MVELIHIYDFMNTVTSESSENKPAKLWVSPDSIESIHDARDFHEEWMDFDFIVILHSGAQFRCIGDPEKVISKINSGVVLYNKG